MASRNMEWIVNDHFKLKSNFWMGNTIVSIQLLEQTNKLIMIQNKKERKK